MGASRSLRATLLGVVALSAVAMPARAQIGASGVRPEHCGRLATSRFESLDQVLPLGFGQLLCLGRNERDGLVLVLDDLAQARSEVVLELDEDAAWGGLGPTRSARLIAAPAGADDGRVLVMVTTSAYFGNSRTIYGRNQGHVLLLDRGRLLEHLSVDDLGSVDVAFDLVSERWRVRGGSQTGEEDPRGHSDVVSVSFVDLEQDGLTEAVVEIVSCQSPPLDRDAKRSERCESFLELGPLRVLVVRADLESDALSVQEVPSDSVASELAQARSALVLDF